MTLTKVRRMLRGKVRRILARISAAGSRYARDVPRCRFGVNASAEQVTEGIDLAGKTVLVTGCNSGLGYETMRVLALRGAHVLGTARSSAKGRSACESVEGRCTPLTLDLADFNSVVSCARQVQALGVPLDIIVCNAGVYYSDRRQAGGLEAQFVVNHLGHFLLVNRLLRELVAAPQGRVVVVGSGSHLSAPANGIQFDDLSGTTWANSGYSHSKLANGLFSLELARRLAGTDATSNSLSPGTVETNILRNDKDSPRVPRLRGPAVGAATTCYVATNPGLASVSGYYFVNCNPRGPSRLMQDEMMARKLWQVSEELVCDYLE